MSVRRPARTCVLPVPQGPDQTKLQAPSDPGNGGTKDNMPDNAFMDTFNARLRIECLNASWFLSLSDAREPIEQWRTDYNEDRPHTALGGLIPKAFAQLVIDARRLA